VGASEAKKAVVEQELQKLKKEHLNVIETQLPQLQKEVATLKNLSDENDIKYSVLDEKFSQLCEANVELENDMAQLREQQKPNHESLLESNEKLEQKLKTLTEQLTLQSTENVNSAKTLFSLKEERDSLEQQLEEAKRLLEEQKKQPARKTASPDAREKRSFDELFVSQNQQLLLEGHRSTPTRASEKNVERKNRRQSVHDERRRLSAWEMFTNAESQTEDVGDICACSELTKKVSDLQIQLRLKDCKISSMERVALHNPLKLDLDDAKKALVREQRDHNHTRGTLDVMSRNMTKMELKVEVLSKNQKIVKETITVSTQATDDLMVQKVKKLLFYYYFNKQ
jgi:hypothetical protein